MRRRSSAAFWRCAVLRRWGPLGACAVISLLLAQCSSSHIDYGVSASPRVIDPGEPVPKGGGSYRVGSPYFVGGRMYVPQYDPHYQAVGLASWYGEDFHGRNTANGEVFDLDSISAAHPTMPLPSYARVTNLANGRSIIVRVNDRGPYAHNRIIDLSVRAAKLLDFYRRGTDFGPRRICRAGTVAGLRRPRAGSDLAREWTGAGAKRGSHRSGSRVSADAATPFVPPGDCQRAPGLSAAAAHRSRGAALYRRRGSRTRCPMPIGETWTVPRSISTGADFIDQARTVRMACS